MTYDFNAPIDRRNSDSVKWNYFDEDVLPLWVADMDFKSPQPVIDAIQDRLEHGLFGYSYPQDSTKKVICDWLERRHDWIVSPEEVLLFPGVVPAFNVAARACTNPGDSVLIQTPAYHPFFDLATNAVLSCSNHSLKPDKKGNYSINLPDFKAKILPTTRIFMLCNPHNPTGRVFSRDELTLMAEACLEKNVIICSDEIHSDIVYSPNRHIPIASLSEEISQSTITLLAPSKTFNLAGLQASVVIIKNHHLRETFIRQTSGFAGTVNILGEAALIAAYTLSDHWLKDLIGYLDKNRRLLFEYVKTELPGVRMALPEGTYLGWLDFSTTTLESPGEFLLDQGKIALSSGDWFGNEYSKYARINFGCPTTTLTSALDRIKSTLIST